MAAPDWVSYAGALTGIGGLILGGLAYRRTGNIKAIDLRVELRKQESDLRSMIQSLPEVLENAKTSHERIAAATGKYQSGAMQAWLGDWQADYATAKFEAQSMPKDPIPCDGLSHFELERALIAVHEKMGILRQVRERYEASVVGDDQDRDHLRQDRRA